VARVDQMQPRLAGDHPPNQLPKNRGLSDSLSQRTADLRRTQHHHQHREEVRNLKVFHRPCLSPPAPGHRLDLSCSSLGKIKILWQDDPSMHPASPAFGHGTISSSQQTHPLISMQSSISVLSVLRDYLIPP